MRKPAFFTLILLCLGTYAHSQAFKNMPGHRFSKEEMHEMLLDHAKKQKTKAIAASISGLVLTGVGVYLVNKDPFTVSGSGGWMSVQESNTAVIGKVIGTTGILTTLASIPLFFSAGKAKREAKLMLADESTSYLGKRISVPSFGLQVCF